MQCDVAAQKTICRCKNLTSYLVFYSHNTHNLAGECGGNNVLKTAYALISTSRACHDECWRDTPNYSFRLRQNQFQTARTNRVLQPSA